MSGYSTTDSREITQRDFLHSEGEECAFNKVQIMKKKMCWVSEGKKSKYESNIDTVSVLKGLLIVTNTCAAVVASEYMQARHVFNLYHTCLPLDIYYTHWLSLFSN